MAYFVESAQNMLFLTSGAIKLLERIADAKKKAAESILSSAENASKAVLESGFIERILASKKNLVDSIAAKGPELAEKAVGAVQVSN